MRLDIKRSYAPSFPGQENGQEDYVTQDGVIFCWSESNLGYERAWWLYLDVNGLSPQQALHVSNLLRDRPIPVEYRPRIG